MEEIKKLEAQLVSQKEQHDLGQQVIRRRIKEEHDLGQQVIKRRINQHLIDRSEGQILRITKNYEMGFLTLFEMINQKIDSLRQVQDNMYNTEL